MRHCRLVDNDGRRLWHCNWRDRVHRQMDREGCHFTRNAKCSVDKMARPIGPVRVDHLSAPTCARQHFPVSALRKAADARPAAMSALLSAVNECLEQTILCRSGTRRSAFVCRYASFTRGSVYRTSIHRNGACLSGIWTADARGCRRVSISSDLFRLFDRGG